MKKLLIFASVLLLSACGKLTQANYDRLEAGMGLAQVKAIIGEPDNCSTTLGTRICIWGEEEGSYIKVSFVGDNALTFSSNGIK